ncbi:NitT/TauT family transport system ATP-binding protein [Mobilisporobacter senegalensis]|uniref:ABC-type quaternary amine transporter n=1 Tax=Mobilisporobacter senegalensis TaxID=1329262 RepID=A0A3N1XGS1_9FIRM|nr:ABC transporter ATP-binding protein [Mobilisporobacter senegalensis]ROR25311.1 NitT/TauT family transport system ATP-binding protein [Mobilisporobacter senegalensis]
MAREERNIKLKIENVKKIFNTRNGEMVALNGINLDILENEFICVVGPSGCGKSTLLNIIAGLSQPSSGKIYCDGHEVTGTGTERGVVFQQYALFPWLTVKKNVEFGLKLQGIKGQEASDIAMKYINMVDLKDFANHYPKELSGGMKQRVAIARAYAVNPSVLLMDEPFGALDAQTRTQLQSELLDTWQKEKKTCFFITHDVDEAIILAQKVIIMSARPGRIKEIVDIDIPYPRNQETKMSKEFLDLKNHIWGQVYQEYLEVRK